MKNGKYSKRRGVASKTLVLALAVMLIVGASIGGTIAWLTDKTDPVTNTFTVGDINITLAETVDNSFKIVPGGTDAKDPTVTVLKGSEKCYVYVLVDNQLVLDNLGVVVTPNINPNGATDWVVVKTDGNKTLYRYKEVVDAASANKSLSVFTSVTYSDKITKGNIDTLNGLKIEITAYAHQSEHVDQTNADAAAIAWAKLPTT